MIKPLRKRHLQIWISIAVLLPVGMVFAWLAVPKPVKDHLWQPASTVALPVILKSLNRENYLVNLRTNNDSSALQLEWINQSLLTSPSAIIYKLSTTDISQHIENADLIGRIDARGTYHFALKKDSANRHQHFVLYDIIHHQIIDQLNF
jgi:superfamily II DNA helicase RecQ